MNYAHGFPLQARHHDFRDILLVKQPHDPASSHGDHLRGRMPPRDSCPRTHQRHTSYQPMPLLRLAHGGHLTRPPGMLPSDVQTFRARHSKGENWQAPVSYRWNIPYPAPSKTPPNPDIETWKGQRGSLTHFDVSNLSPAVKSIYRAKLVGDEIESTLTLS